MEQNRKLKVFLCHSKDDKPKVRELYHRLVSYGIDVWLDEKSLLPGINWEREIRRNLRLTDVIVVCLSDKSVKKTGFFQKEIKLALDVADEKPEDAIFIIPARLEDCSMPDRLNSRQWVNLFEDNGFERLMSSLKKCANDNYATLIPSDLNRVPLEEVKIGIWGSPNSGKSTYITMLQYTDAPGWRIGPRGKETQDIFLDYSELLRDKLTFVPATIPNRVSYLNFDFINPNNRQFRVIFPEAAGEYYEKPEKNLLFVEEMSKCKAILWFIDPERIEQRERSYSAMIKDWLQRLYKFQGKGKGETLNQYMAFCLTKMDLPPHSNNFLFPKEYCFSKLDANMGDVIYKYCEYRKVNFFAISSIGFIPGSFDSVIDPNDPSRLRYIANPINLFSPFYWLFSLI